MIAIVDYGLGNLKSVACAFRRVGCEAIVTSEAKEIFAADGVVLPGVGAFEKAMENLNALGLADALRRIAGGEKPFLGICLGLQLLFERSREHGLHDGLAVLRGEVVRFSAAMKVPHMGWNQVSIAKGSPLFDGVPDRSYFYFAHSYHVEPSDQSVILGRTDYGKPYVSAVSRGNTFGLQFHPEKSGRVGLQVIENFARLARR